MVFTHGFAFNPFSTAFLARRAAPTTTDGLEVLVQEDGRGRARVGAGVPLLRYALRVYSVSQVEGSVYGGTLVTFTGTGFDADIAGNEVAINGTSSKCVVVWASHERMTCRMPSLREVYLAGGAPTQCRLAPPMGGDAPA